MRFPRYDIVLVPGESSTAIMAYATIYEHMKRTHTECGIANTGKVTHVFRGQSVKTMRGVG
jgi:hypothetical protein